MSSNITEPMHPVLKTLLCTLGKTAAVGILTNASREETGEIFFKALESCIESNLPKQTDECITRQAV